ncbi:MAG: hypothetical protein N4A49_00010 [Marinifilaceae bacterium]|jgi:16S rRNA processing protein RimM|nr:hypothetical protein [Marinifilaceae bacterium]
MLYIEDCFYVGTFLRTHGVRGELIVKTNTDLLTRNNWESILVDIDGGLVPFFVVKGGIKNRSAETIRLTIEDINDENHAKIMIGNNIYLPKDSCDDLVEEDTIPDHLLLVGYTYCDSEQGEIGVIEHVDDFSGNIILNIVTDDEEELMIPFIQENFVAVEEDVIIMNTPDGLLDINS